MPPVDPFTALRICNACGYCDGYCEVFRAATRRHEPDAADLAFLASLCHACGDCFPACQYAPPHVFALNLPRLLAEERLRTYRRHAWPRAVAGSDWIAALTFILLGPALALLSVPASVLFAPHLGAGAFYAVVPWWLMATLGAVATLWAALALAIGVRRYWREIARGRPVRWRALKAALGDVLSLRNLGGGGVGCAEDEERFSRTRRWMHHAMFYGVLACLAATVAATLWQHALGIVPPFAWTSPPVVLGAAGGAAMLVGALGAAWRTLRRPVPWQAPAARGAALAMLAWVAALAGSGLLLLALRATAAMGLLLALHLGVVAAFLLLLPFGSLAHGAYRFAALLLAAMERAPPPALPPPPAAAYAGGNEAAREDNE